MKTLSQRLAPRIALALSLAAPAWAQPDATEPAPVGAPPASAEPAPIEAAPATPPAAPAAAAAPAPEEPQIHLASSPPPRGDSRTYRRHDGFYVRTNLGIGRVWSGLDDAGTQDSDVDVSATAMTLDLLIGGSPTPGITLGGGVLGQLAFGASFEREGDEDLPDSDYQDWTVGAFIDGFPRDTGPWHLGGLVGLAMVNVDQDDYVQRTLGVGGALWAGYDQWVADDWALGGQLRLTMSQTAGEERGFDVSAATFGLGLAFSALYH